MPPASTLSLLPFILSAIAAVVSAGEIDPLTGVETIPAPNNKDGFCYYCTSENAPPLCNRDCDTAIQRLCAEDLDEALTTIEGTCELSYLPPAWQWNTKGAGPVAGTEQKCIEQFKSIISGCGRNAGDEPTYDLNYCTPAGSAGGGTFGWWDDGTPIKDSPRMIIKTANTHQCGQAMAAHQQATKVVVWNDDWVKPGDQVVIEVNPPSMTNDLLASITALPTPNPVCADGSTVCDIFDHPYYAKAVSNPWQDGTDRQLRHRVVYDGWATQQPSSDRFFDALAERCQAWPNNWQVWKNDTATIADFGLPSWQKDPLHPAIFDVGDERDFCWCIPYAIFAASVGLETSVTGFCSPGTKFPGTAEFAPAKRGLEVHEGPGMFRAVTGTVEDVRAKKAKRHEKREVERIKRAVAAYENVGEEES